MEFLSSLEASGLSMLFRLAALAIAIPVHEAMHAFAAYRMGDPTPKIQGRITLNPFAHFDLVGTLMILFAPIGWGKPVIYNPRNFRSYKWGTIVTAIAGPIGNLVTAILLAIPLKYGNLAVTAPILHEFITFTYMLNLMLMIFNMLPIPPLDGSKVLMMFMPDKYILRYEYWMMKSGLHYFIIFFIGDYALASFTGFSILRTILFEVFWPVHSVIMLSI